MLSEQHVNTNAITAPSGLTPSLGAWTSEDDRRTGANGTVPGGTCRSTRVATNPSAGGREAGETVCNEKLWF